MNITAIIKDADNKELRGLRISSGQIKRLKIGVDNTSTGVFVRCLRADFNSAIIADEDISVSRGNGQELLDNGLIKGRLIGGPWVDLATNRLALGPITAGNEVEIDVTIDADSTINTIGQAALGLVVEANKE